MFRICRLEGAEPLWKCWKCYQESQGCSSKGAAKTIRLTNSRDELGVRHGPQRQKAERTASKRAATTAAAGAARVSALGDAAASEPGRKPRRQKTQRTASAADAAPAPAPANPEPTAVALGTAPPPAVRQASALEEIDPVGVVSLPETTAAPQIPSRQAFLRMRSMQRPSGTTTAKRAQAPTCCKAAATTDDFYRGVRRKHCERPQLRVPRASEISV